VLIGPAFLASNWCNVVEARGEKLRAESIRLSRLDIVDGGGITTVSAA
jgi:hypothetical protein